MHGYLWRKNVQFFSAACVVAIHETKVFDFALDGNKVAAEQVDDNHDNYDDVAQQDYELGQCRLADGWPDQQCHCASKLQEYPLALPWKLQCISDNVQHLNMSSIDNKCQRNCPDCDNWYIRTCCNSPFQLHCCSCYKSNNGFPNNLETCCCRDGHGGDVAAAEPRVLTVQRTSYLQLQGVSYKESVSERTE